MRLTKDGGALTALLGLTLFAALASGNNLLYLLYGLLLSSLVVSIAALRINMSSLRITVEPPKRIFQNRHAFLKVRIQNSGRFSSRYIAVSRGSESFFAKRIQPDTEETGLLPVDLPHRGKNSVEGLRVESSYPFGLIKMSRPIDNPILIALPRPRDIRAPSEFNADVSGTGRLIPVRGSGEELYSVREYDPSDDSRLINWKMSARSGKIIVNTFASNGGSKITVRLPPAAKGPQFEAAVVEAASACRFYILSGAEIKLVTENHDGKYGRGLDHLDKMLTVLALSGEGNAPRQAVAPQRSRSPNTPARTASWLTTCYAGAALILGSLLLIDEIHPAAIYCALMSLPLAAWMDVREGKRIPEFLWHAGSVLVLAYLLLFGWRLNGITLSNTYLIIFILLNLLFRPKERPEYRQIFLVFFLGFFLISGQTIRLWYFLSFVLYTALAAAWMLQAQEDKPLQRIPWGPFSVLLPMLLILTGGLFAVTPRLEPLKRMNPFVAMGLDKRRPKKDFSVQFSRNVSLGFFGTLKRSSARIMRVRPRGDKIPPYLRIRGGALDFFDGKHWSKTAVAFRYYLAESNKPRDSTAGKAWIKRENDRLIFPGTNPGDKVNDLEFTLFPLNSSVLFTVGRPALIESAQQSAYFDHTDSISFMAPYFAGAKYRLLSKPKIGFDEYIENYDAVLTSRFLQLPSLDPAVRAYAKRMTGEANTPYEKIKLIETRLREDLSYSLYSDDPDRDLSDFLFKAKSGNCEYFATAAAVLLRSVGVPTRLVTGFLADDWNEYGKFFDVRQGQAHAWTEAYVAGSGWMTVDATPAGADTRGQKRKWLTRLSRYYEALQFKWYRHVIGYDRFIQKNSFMRIGQSLNGDRLQKTAERGFKNVVVVMIFGFACAALSRLYKKLKEPPPNLFQQAESVLARHGFRTKAHETPREFAALVKLGCSRPVPELDDIVDMHYRDKYSPGGLSPKERRRAEILITRLGRRRIT